MSDDWMKNLHPDMQRLLEENPNAVRQATDTAAIQVERGVTNRDQQLEAQALRIDGLTPENIQQAIDSPVRDVPDNSREPWDRSETNFAPRVLDEAQNQANDPASEVKQPEPDYDAMRAADHEQSELEAALEREKPEEVKEAELEANYQDYVKDHLQEDLETKAPEAPENGEEAQKQREEEERRQRERDRDDD